MTTLTSFGGFGLTARCAGCDRVVPDWEERTEGAELQSKLESSDGVGMLVECETVCPACESPRIRLSFRIG